MPIVEAGRHLSLRRDDLSCHRDDVLQDMFEIKTTLVSSRQILQWLIVDLPRTQLEPSAAVIDFVQGMRRGDARFDDGTTFYCQGYEYGRVWVFWWIERE